MASKFGLAGGIPERRVRPIWDAIDSRQFKNALKHSATLLAKHPNSPYALALKALILERMGKSNEALSICINAKEVLYKNDSLLMDDLTLSTLQIVFQRLDHLELATSCYEHACGKHPNNLELMMGLFNCYVREYSFVKQQQTAIRMYKLVGEERFLLWAVCSIQLQVLCANGEDKLLLLAEGLLKKHVASHSLHEPEALIVYISILEQQAKYADALEILAGKLGSLLMMEVDRLRIEGRLLARAGDYSAAAVVYQKILKLCPDDWEGFLHYLGCVWEDDSNWRIVADDNPIPRSKVLDCSLSHLADEVFDCRTSDASAFVQKLQEDTRDSFIRGPYLAGLEIKRRKHLYGKANDNEIIEALMQYFSIFGHLACFTSDVEALLQVLVPNKRMEFNEQLVKDNSSLPVDLTKMLGQSITLFKVQDVMGNIYTRLPVSELEGTAVQMVKLFFESLPLAKDLDPQESMQGEELLSLACNVLVQLFWRTRHLGYLVEAIMVLEFGLSIRRYVWQYKILLVHLYSFLGALSLAYEWYKLLDVKNILMETVSHHMVPQLLESPLWVELNNLLKDYLRFMDDYFRESADLTFLAYRHRNYSKVIEFVQFKEHLQRSNQYLVAKVEASILLLKQNADNLEEEERVLESLNCGIHFAELSNDIGTKSLTFNEDLQSRPWWTPTSGKNYLLGPFEGISYCPKENLTKEREAKVRRAIERRSFLPRMVYLSIQSASAPLKDDMEVNGSVSEPKIYSELKFLLEQYAKLLGFSLSDAIEVVMGSFSIQKSSEVFHSDMVDWMNFAVFLNAWKLCSNERKQLDRDGCAPGIWHTVNSLLEKYISEVVKSMEPLIHPSNRDLSFLVQVVSEPLAWHILVIQSCVRSFLPSGKKKKKGGSTDNSLSPLAIATQETIQILCGILEEVSRWLGEEINRPEDENLETILSSVRQGRQSEGPGQVFQDLGALISSISETELGVSISEALKSWNPVDVARKIATGRSSVLSEFLHICERRIKSLWVLKHQIAQL
ncbi:phagocyte signaling-impaired protein [Tripterygium wilfordii]|uniref:Phagocyte signaling-impaired protein n=1 Tax=Tripterygium wilfordii TaxID=458696 RepID=A0A7J7DDN2_TRIWF|nr:N-terminal acetyltransferase B complex auxiliary subunit NAA25-like [Tripterygium wilfordii]KAF5744470.1 phagocyte signaling-impaired protein [Tripterygium wilfordii]